MSGQAIGTAVGFVAGFFLPGGPQVWATFGGMIGGWVDPAKVSQSGPRLSDGGQQTAQVGLPIPEGDGTFSTRGNVIWVQPGPPTEVPTTTTDDGKGSGVETSTTVYNYFLDYAIGICQGPADLLVAKRNGATVYDVRPDAELIELGYTANDIAALRAATAKWRSRITVYRGDETQGPDPTIESWLGVGNVNYHRGLHHIVVNGDDVTELRGAIAQWDFVVRTCGEVSGYYVEPGAWVADSNAASVHRFLNGEQDTFTVAGSDKFGIGMSPDSRYVWVLNSTNGSAPYSISKVSTVDGDVSLTFPVTGTPRQLIPSPDGDFLYVGDGSDNSVVKYGAGGGGEVGRTADLGADPGHLAISADGSEVYAGVTGVKVIDTSDMSVTTTIAAAAGTISGLALSPTDPDKLYAIVSLASGYLAIDLAAGTYVTKAGINGPAGLCFAVDGAMAYIVSGTNNNIAKIDASTDNWVGDINVGASFQCIATDLNGENLFVGSSAFGSDLRQVDIASELIVNIFPDVNVYQRRGIVARPLP